MGLVWRHVFLHLSRWWSFVITYQKEELKAFNKSRLETVEAAIPSFNLMMQEHFFCFVFLSLVKLIGLS